MLTANVWVDDIIYSRDIALSNDTLGCGLIDYHLFPSIDANSKLYLNENVFNLIRTNKKIGGRKDSKILSNPDLNYRILD